MTKSKTRTHTSSQPQQWDPVRYQRNVAYVPKLGNVILAWLNPQSGERILDLGCGEGSLTEELSKQGAQVMGVDADPAMVRAAQARGLEVQQMNGHTLSFSQEFDAIFSNAALHWMLDAQKVIQGVARALKPKGRFVAEFGGHGNIAAIITAMRAVLRAHRVDDSVPMYFPSAEDYCQRLETHGFRVCRCELVARATLLPQGMQGWLESFGGAMLNRLPEIQRDAARQEVIRLLEPVLCDAQGQWHADYVRLRIEATLT